MRLALLCLAAASVAFPAIAQQTPPRTNPPSQASGQQPGGLGTTGEGGVTRGSQGPGSGAGMNPSGSPMGSPGQTTGGATAWTSQPTETGARIVDEDDGSAVSVRPGAVMTEYGLWSPAWGARPPAPPASWTNRSDWNRHVRACQQRYRSYRPETDSYRTYSGRTVRCTL